MTGLLVAIAVLAVAGVAAAVLLGLSRRLLNRDKQVAGVDLRGLHDATSADESGAVCSIQAADMVLPTPELDGIWTPMHLERLARTYWRFLSRVTLGMIRVVYTERERYVVLLWRRLRLLTFQAPEYAMDGDHGRVRWRIERGLLVARKGRGGDGYLQIDVRRHPAAETGRSHLHVEVAVVNFYPAIAHAIGRWVYNETQSRIHVIVTHGFLRSLARLDLAESRVGRYADDASAPGPAPPESAARFQRDSTAPEHDLLARG